MPTAPAWNPVQLHFLQQISLFRHIAIFPATQPHTITQMHLVSVAACTLSRAEISMLAPTAIFHAEMERFTIQTAHAWKLALFLSRLKMSL